MREPITVQVMVQRRTAGEAPDLGAIALLVREGLERLDTEPQAARLCLAAAERLLAPPDADAQGGLLAWQIKRVGLYLDSRLDDRITLKAAAEQARLSPSYFSRCFRRSFGAPFAKFVMRKRVERAQHLMVTSSMSLGQIALACGFADQAHFTRAFTGLTGGAPGRWRRWVADRAEAQPAPSRAAVRGARPIIAAPASAAARPCRSGRRHDGSLEASA